MKVRNFLEKKPGPVKLFGRFGGKDSPDQEKSAPEEVKAASEEEKAPVKDTKPAPEDVKSPVKNTKPTPEDVKSPVKNTKSAPEDVKSPVKDTKTAPKEDKPALKGIKAALKDVKVKTPVMHKKQDADSTEVKETVTVDTADEGSLADKDNLDVTDKGKSRLTAITGNISGAFGNAARFMRSLSPKMYLTVTLLGIMLVAATIGIVTALILHHADNLPLTAPYSNKDLVYQASEDTALAVSSALSSDLCVGKDNTSTGDIVLKEGESAALFDLEDKEVIFAKNMYEKIYPASITKIMTAILTLKYGNMDDVVTIMWRDLELESGSQVVGFHIGDQVTVRELLHGLLVHSGNDAAMALARYVGGGSMNSFIQMMNDELVQIGATGSHFTNPTGLQDSDHYTTVYDIYLMLNEAIKYSDFVSIMQISVYNVTYTTAEGETKFVNLDSTDHYLTGEIKPPKDVVVLGGKTGTTSSAGHCLAIVSQNAFGQPYISIIVGAQTTEDLYEDMNVLLSEIN